jgi:hypothetical protein
MRNTLGKKGLAMSLTAVVTYHEDHAVSVGRFLVENGYGLASSTGRARPKPVADSSVGILFRDEEPTPRRRFRGLFGARRRHVLGTIWFDNTIRNAASSSWVFEVNGRQYADRANELARGLASHFSVEISVRLMSEDPIEERHEDD